MFGLGKAVVRCDRFEHGRDRQFVFACEIKVTLVVCGTAKDRACAVVHQNEVGDVNGQFPRRIKRVTHADACVKAALFGLFQLFLGRAHTAAFCTELRDRGVVLFQITRQRVIRRDTNKRRAHQRIGACCVHLNPVMCFGAVDGRECKLKTARFADPVRLHQFDLGRPVVQRVQRFQQFVGIVGNLEEPLRQFTAFDQRTRAPAATVFNLLVRQNRHVDRVPVHDGVLAVDQTFFKEIKEQRLLLAVVFRIAGGEHARPVQTKAKRFHLGNHRVDVVIGPRFGVAVRCHRRVFCRHPEGVKAHRVQNVVARRQFIARDHVAHGVVADVTDVDAARRIGEHLKHIILGLVFRAHGFEGFGLIPGSLPLWFDLGGCVTRHGSSSATRIQCVFGLG